MHTHERLIQKISYVLNENNQEIFEHMDNQTLAELGEALSNYHVELEAQNTELRQTQEELISSSQNYKTLIDFCPIGLIQCDSNMKVTLTNTLALQYLNITHMTSQNRNITTFIGGYVMDFLNWVQTGEYKEIPFELKINRDSKQRHYRIYGSYLQQSKEPYYLFALTDTTEDNKNRQMLIDQSRQATMGEMLNMIAHQWRQPISSIGMIAINMLMDIEFQKFTEEKAKNYVAEIQSLVHFLSDTIDDFRELSHHNKNKETILLSELISKGLTLIGKSLKSHGIRVKINIEEDFKLHVVIGELLQILLNILNNAKDIFIIREIQSPTITICATRQEKTLSLYIKDNGGGIAFENTSRIFEAYVSTKEQKNHSGLGLYMSKKIIEESMGGHIHAYNMEDGAVFHIELPIVENPLQNAT